MGKNETELAQIRASGPFAAPSLVDLRHSLAALADSLKRVAASGGWEGLSADAVAVYFERWSGHYLELEAAVLKLEKTITQANGDWAEALRRYDGLPAAKAPSWVHGMLETFDFPGIPDPIDLAQGGLALIEGHLGALREAEAGRILADYNAALARHATDVDIARTQIAQIEGRMRQEDGPPFPPDDDTTGSWTDGGAYRRPGYDGVDFVPPRGGTPWSSPSIDDDGVVIGVDDPNAGVLPGGPGGSGSTAPTGLGGGGLPGVVGAGAGTAVAGAGALAATRFAGGAVGGVARGGAALGGAVRGGGGLLGAAGPGMGGQGANAGRAAAASSGRGGSGLLGSSGVNGAQGRDDRKRKTGRGLGGPIAPQLEDEDETVLPGSGSRAGGRDESADSGLDG